MNIRYVYSACVEIDTVDAKILCDPWFSQGAYYGAWYHYPYHPEMVSSFRGLTHIYISHIHPDHYDPSALRVIIQNNPNVKVIIKNFTRKILARVMAADGFIFEEVDDLTCGSTMLRICESRTHEDDIDSYLLITDGKFAFGNFNDCVYSDVIALETASFLKMHGLDRFNLAAVPYCGAGPYPQCYFDVESEKEQLLLEASRKKVQFLDQLRSYVENVSADRFLPFAGSYLLGGHLSKLNEFRGIPDAIETLSISDKIRVPADGGEAIFSCSSLTWSHERIDAYDPEDIKARVNDLQKLNLYYEELQIKIPNHILHRLCDLAVRNMQIRYAGELSYVFNIISDEFEFKTFINSEVETDFEFHIWIDRRLLFLLITGIYHWDNAEIGSLYTVDRGDMPYDRYVINALNYCVVF